MNELYWSWWQGGAGLAAIAIGYHLTVQRSLGFSGIFERVLFKRETEKLDKAESIASDEQQFMAAMLAATQEEMGQGDSALKIDSNEPVLQENGWFSNLLFVIGVFFGGIIAALSSSSFNFRWDLDAVHSVMMGSNSAVIFTLLVGGLLVGFGTRMAGGCTSGHGLNGCGQLQISSIVATASFFGTAIVVSQLMEYLS